jgi:uncharacterized hydrophobic protein (TIGR00271 family)
MIVAPLMTPILGIVLAVLLADWANLRRCVLLVLVGAAAVVAVGWLLGLAVPYPVIAATDGQVAARVTPRIVDLVAALATGSVGSVALARSDISDTLPGVAIAISLVPPLSVAGLTLESGAPSQALGALLLFATNVAAILASGIVVMTLYRVSRVSDQTPAPAFHLFTAATVIAVLLLAVLVPLSINSNRIDKAMVRQSEVQAVADRWAQRRGLVGAGRHRHRRPGAGRRHGAESRSRPGCSSPAAARRGPERPRRPGQPGPGQLRAAAKVGLPGRPRPR